jgi:hypothetical protein
MPADDELHPQLLKPLIDLNLPPIRVVSLQEWNEIYRWLGSQNKLEERAVFALTGHFTGPTDGELYRAKLDILSCRATQRHILHRVNDFDSVIGIVQDQFPIRDNATLFYYPLASPTHTLTSNLHIPDIELENEEGVLKVWAGAFYFQYSPELILLLAHGAAPHS